MYSNILILYPFILSLILYTGLYMILKEKLVKIKVDGDYDEYKKVKQNILVFMGLSIFITVNVIVYGIMISEQLAKTTHDIDENKVVIFNLFQYFNILVNIISLFFVSTYKGLSYKRDLKRTMILFFGGLGFLPLIIITMYIFTTNA